MRSPTRLRNVTESFSEIAGAMRLTGGENHLVTLIGRRRGECQIRAARLPSSRGCANLRAMAFADAHNEDLAPHMPKQRTTTRTLASSPSFRARYDALEQRRLDLLARLAALGEKARANPGHSRALTLLNATFRKASLVQRAAILEAADWLIALIDRSTMIL
jgi:hypothetical protein